MDCFTTRWFSHYEYIWGWPHLMPKGKRMWKSGEHRLSANPSDVHLMMSVVARSYSGIHHCTSFARSILMSAPGMLIWLQLDPNGSAGEIGSHRNPVESRSSGSGRVSLVPHRAFLSGISGASSLVAPDYWRNFLKFAFHFCLISCLILCEPKPTVG